MRAFSFGIPMQLLKIKDWERHQHYGKRSPPWIKFYRTTLEDYAIASLPDAAKAHLFGVWLLAAATDGTIPNDPAWVGKKINATEPVDLQRLIDLGLLLACDASIMRYHQVLSSEEERRGEQRREDLSVVPPTNGTPGALALTPDPDPPPKPRKKREPKPEGAVDTANWVQEALVIWEEIGVVAPGRMGSALKPVVARYGQETALKALRSYVKNKPWMRRDGTIWGDLPGDSPDNQPPRDIRFCSPNDFAATLSLWLPTT